jgi:outer membrane protein assembly factor BamB
LKVKFKKSCFAFGIILLITHSGISSDVLVDKEFLDIENDIVEVLPIFSNKNCTYESNKYEEYLSKKYFKLTEDNINLITESFESDIVKGSMNPIDSPWPMKCHDNRHTSQSPYSTANNSYDEIWRFETDGWVEDNPTIGNDGTLYFGGNFDGLPWYIIAVYPNGTLKWKYKTNGLILGSSPAIAEDGTIYIGSWDSKLYAINPDGTLKWKTGVSGNVASSPAIGDDGTIYVGAMGFGSNGRISAVNPNGTRKWYYDTNDVITSDPTIAEDGTIYIGSQDNYLYAMNPDGTLKWRYETGHHIRGPPSIAVDGTIYIGSVDKHLHAIYPNGTMRWKHYVGDEISTNPSLGEDGTIYCGGNKFWAINPNGTRKWTFNMGNDRHVDSSSPAISSDGTIYFGTNIGDGDGGEIIAVNPDGTERWREKIAGYWVESSPSIGEDGTIYIGSSHNMDKGWLHAFNRADLSADADGPYYGLIDEPVQFNGTGYGGYRPYSWYWDFGDGNTSTERNPSHIYTESGNYSVTLEVIDDSGNTSEDTTWAWIQNSNLPPDTPSIDGVVNGKIETKYDYTFQSSDPEGLHIWHIIEWGDGKDTGWIGPYKSGDEIVRSHQWLERGSFIIKCKAKDPYGTESEWGELEVTMPKNKQFSSNLFLRFLQNHPLMFPILRQLLNL